MDHKNGKIFSSKVKWLANVISSDFDGSLYVFGICVSLVLCWLALFSGYQIEIMVEGKTG